MAGLSALELLFDAATESAIRRQWEALAGAGMSSLAAHTAASNRPHVTLVARESFDESHLRRAVSLVRVPVPVVVGGVVLFGPGPAPRPGADARRVLAREVRFGHEVRAARNALAEGTQGSTAGDDGPWVPHVTLARRLKADQHERALELVGLADDAGADVGTSPDGTGGLRGEAVALRLWDARTRLVTVLSGTDPAEGA
jgi:2'-5' RNA ligase